MTSAVLAPTPDFRYVRLASSLSNHQTPWLTLAGACVGAGAGVFEGMSSRAAFVLTMAASTSAYLVGRLRDRSHRANMAIVPWGVIVDPDDSPRVFRWAGVKSVNCRSVHGRESGTAVTRFSVVTVETDRDKFTGSASGAAPLDRLMAYLSDYTEEQSTAVALDLEGREAFLSSFEPDCEPLITSAQAYLASAEGARHLGLPAAGYRRSGSRVASPETTMKLRAVLRNRSRHAADPRPFAAVLAAELGISELADDLVALVQSPHPTVAAVSKLAAQSLGVSTARVGALDEVFPFLDESDQEKLSDWASGCGAPVQAVSRAL